MRVRPNRENDRLPIVVGKIISRLLQHHIQPKSSKEFWSSMSLSYSFGWHETQGYMLVKEDMKVSYS